MKGILHLNFYLKGGRSVEVSVSVVRFMGDECL